MLQHLIEAMAQLKPAMDVVKLHSWTLEQNSTLQQEQGQRSLQVLSAREVTNIAEGSSPGSTATDVEFSVPYDAPVPTIKFNNLSDE